MPEILRALANGQSHNKPHNKHSEIAVAKDRCRGKTGPRKKHDREEPRPIPAATLRRVFGTAAKRIDEDFCRNRLWWWRPLLKALDPDFARKGCYRVPESRQGFFPAHVFETLQAHHDAGEMHSLLHLWRVTEIGERIPELSSQRLEKLLPALRGSPGWPAYVVPSTYYSSSIELHRATLGPLEINLRESDRAIMARVMGEVERLRVKALSLDDRVRPAGSSNRNLHFNLAAFAIVEVIDRHVVLGEEKERLQWANVRKAIEEAYE